MLTFGLPQAEGSASHALATLTDAVWVLAALVELLNRGPRERYDVNDNPARVLAAAGLLVHRGDHYALTSGLAELMEHGGRARAEAAVSAIGQASMVARGGSLEGSWAQQDDETLLAQGRASGRGISQGLPLLFAQVPGLEQSLSSAEARFLDVGVGVGALACAIAEAIPSLFVVGIDPFERALTLASRHIAERGLEDRVTLRRCGVEDITDEATFDLVWMPAPFIPSQAFIVGVSRVHRALRPGGWVLVGMGRLEGETVAVEVTRWQTALIGGTPLTPEEADVVLRQAGFEDLRRLASPPGTPHLVAGQRSGG